MNVHIKQFQYKIVETKKEKLPEELSLLSPGIH